MRSSPRDTKSLRVVHGKVDAGGLTLVPGSSDWICTKTATGTYIIRFPGFKVLPSVVGQIAGLNLLYLVTVLADQCQFNTYVPSAAGTLADAGFSFRIEGR